MIYIENVFVCLAAPLLVAALCMGRKYLRFFLFAFAGMGACLAVLVLLNIPTAIFLAVYRTTRRHFAEKRNMDHRDIQDL